MRMNVKETWTEKHRNVARKTFLEGGWTQKETSILVGRMLVNVKHANLRKAQKGTGCSTVQNGTKSARNFLRPSESGSKRRERRRKSGSDKEVSSRILAAKASGKEETSE